MYDLPLAETEMKIYWNGNSKNIIGDRVRQFRSERGLSQMRLAELLQLEGMECSDLTVLRIEKGQRFVPDYEIKVLAKVLAVTYSDLLDGKTEHN